MNRTDKLLYHQIHPLKLAVDIGSCIASSALLWRHEVAIAMLVTWPPAIAASLLIPAFASLERQAASRLGRYVRSTMTPAVMAQRMTGQVVMWLAAYHQDPLGIALGALVIVLAWLSGLQRS
jgi:hypothetical protein